MVIQGVGGEWVGGERRGVGGRKDQVLREDREVARQCWISVDSLFYAKADPESHYIFPTARR